MVSCCVKKCGARKNKNKPELTLHRFPVNKVLKKRWIEIIGFDNINPRHKTWHICSLHFEENSFNKTLDVMRLREGALPSAALLDPDNNRNQELRETPQTPDSTCSMYLEISNNSLNDHALLTKNSVKNTNKILHVTQSPDSVCSMMMEISTNSLNDHALLAKSPHKINNNLFCETNTPEKTCPMMLQVSNNSLNDHAHLTKSPDQRSVEAMCEIRHTPESMYAVNEVMPDNEIRQKVLLAKIAERDKTIKLLTEKCILLKRKIRGLNEKIRRRDVRLCLLLKT